MPFSTSRGSRHGRPRPSRRRRGFGSSGATTVHCASVRSMSPRTTAIVTTFHFTHSGFMRWVLTSSAGKWANIRWFSSTVQSYQLAPSVISLPIALSVAAAESALGVLLLLSPSANRLGRWAAWLIAGFTVAVLINLVRGRRNMSCGCGPLMPEQRLSWYLLLRNGGFIGVSVLATISSLSPLAGWLTFGVALTVIWFALAKHSADVA